MSFAGRQRRGGLGWLVLMAIPPVVVIAGLIAVLIWQGAKGGIRPKWKKAPEAGASVPAGAER